MGRILLLLLMDYRIRAFRAFSLTRMEKNGQMQSGNFSEVEKTCKLKNEAVDT